MSYISSYIFLYFLFFIASFHFYLLTPPVPTFHVYLQDVMTLDTVTLVMRARERMRLTVLGLNLHTVRLCREVRESLAVMTGLMNISMIYLR